MGLDQLPAIGLGNGVSPVVDPQHLEYVSKIPLEGRVADGEVEIVVIIARYQSKEWFAEMAGLLLGKGPARPDEIEAGHSGLWETPSGRRVPVRSTLGGSSAGSRGFGVVGDC